MKYTLLEMTQSILSNLNSDEVNSIGDTTESLQVAEIIKQTYFNMMAKYDLPENNQLVQLTASTDNLQPVLMFKPDGISRIEWVKYFDTNIGDSASLQQDEFGSFQHGLNTDIQGTATAWRTTSTTSNTIGLGSFTFQVNTGLPILPGQNVLITSDIMSMRGTVTSYVVSTLVVDITTFIGSGTFADWIISQDVGAFGPGYLNVKYLPIEQFLAMTNKLNPTDQNVGSFLLTVINQNSGEPNEFIFYYKDDVQPKYYTVISDYYFVFDAYDRTQDSTLQSSKTMCLAWVLPVFSITDDFIPPLDDNMFPLLLNEAKSLAFIELKQVTHSKAEMEIKRQISSLQKFKAVKESSWFSQLPDFGRRGGMHGQNPRYENKWSRL